MAEAPVSYSGNQPAAGTTNPSMNPPDPTGNYAPPPPQMYPSSGSSLSSLLPYSGKQRPQTYIFGTSTSSEPITMNTNYRIKGSVMLNPEQGNSRQVMETIETSLLDLLRDISEATRRRKEPDADYRQLLRKIFEKGEESEVDYQYHQLMLKIFKKGKLSDSIMSTFSPEDVIVQEIPAMYAKKVRVQKSALRSGKSLWKGGLHADPEVDLSILKSKGIRGRRLEMTQLLLKCCNPNKGIQLSAIPIVGAAGIGKTTLALLIYQHELVLNHFEMQVWVKVNGQLFNLHHAAQELLKSATGMSCSIDDLDELDELVLNTLQWQRCLIVFDGVESMAEDVWLHMNNYWFSLVDLGSVVLITTPSEGVSNLVSNDAFELQSLSQNDGWSLYQYLEVDSTYKVEFTSKNLEALCGGIPLLLKLAGSMMIYDDKIRNLLSNVHFSDAPFLSNFDASVVILLCIWALPLQLRQCLALCSIYPKGYVLNREKIINLWAALVQKFPKYYLDYSDSSYFHQLLCRSFFTGIARNEYGEITDFQMPGVIHTMMQDVASIVLKGKVGVISSISKDAHQLSLNSEGPEEVAALILSSTLHSGASSLNYTLLDFKELKSLDLSCSGIRNLSHDICALRRLECLNLSYTLIERLPDSITSLRRLNTLDLSCCYHFKFLPKELHNLRYMTLLNLSQCESLSCLPSGIGSLKSLTSMPLFVLGKDHDSARLGELGLLDLLRGRLEIRNLENVMEISEARDAKLNQKLLHHLRLCWSKDVGDCFEVLELLEPDRRLNVFDITGYMGSRFPQWISSTYGLVKISITNCGCVELPSLGQLRHLKELQLKGMANIQHIGPEFYGDQVTHPFESLE